MATYTDQQLQALKDALATGTLRVRFADRDVTYRSVAELKTAIATVQNELDVAAGTQPKRQVRIWTSKGIGIGDRI